MNNFTCTNTQSHLSPEQAEEQRKLTQNLSDRVVEIMLAQPLNPFNKLSLSVYVG